MYIKDYDPDDPPICPLLSIACHRPTKCSEEHCMWWVQPKDADYSECAVHGAASGLQGVTWWLRCIYEDA